MAYESVIEDTEIVQGDSTKIWFFGLPDNSVLGADWTAKYSIIPENGGVALVTRDLPKNSGTGFGDKYTAGTKFVFQIYPSESSILTAGEKYKVGVEIKNDTIPYRSEIAQFKVKILPQIVS